jgi:hypothetical protein
MNALLRFAKRLRNPEDLGHAVTKEVRELARQAELNYLADQMQSITTEDASLMLGQLTRLRIIERAAWHALELAHQDRSADAYDTLANALEVKTCALG